MDFTHFLMDLLLQIHCSASLLTNDIIIRLDQNAYFVFCVVVPSMKMRMTANDLCKSIKVIIH